MPSTTDEIGAHTDIDGSSARRAGGTGKERGQTYTLDEKERTEESNRNAEAEYDRVERDVKSVGVTPTF